MEEIATATDASARTLLGFELPRCPASGQPGPALGEVAHRLGLVKLDWSFLAPHLIFDARQYRRVRLWRDEHWEAVLLCWLPGQRTTVHDHAGSTGVSKVLMGGLHEVRYAWEPGHAPVAIGSQGLLTGEVTTEQVSTIHDVSNETHYPAASFHLYSPPLTVLGAYDRVGGTRYVVDVTDSPAVQVGGDPRLGA